jgi:hypothetical protein
MRLGRSGLGACLSRSRIADPLPVPLAGEVTERQPLRINENGRAQRRAGRSLVFTTAVAAPLPIWRNACQVSSVHAPPRCGRWGVGGSVLGWGRRRAKFSTSVSLTCRGVATPGPWLRRWRARVSRWLTSLGGHCFCGRARRRWTGGGRASERSSMRHGRGHAEQGYGLNGESRSAREGTRVFQRHRF